MQCVKVNLVCDSRDSNFNPHIKELLPLEVLLFSRKKKHLAKNASCKEDELFKDIFALRW